MMPLRPFVLWCALALAAAPVVGQFRLPVKLGELEQRAKADSNDPAAHFNVALAYWNAKRWDDAERALRLAVVIDPQFAEGWLALSRLPFAKRRKLWDDIAERRVSSEDLPRVEEAYRLYQRALLIDPLVDLRAEAAVTPGKSAYWVASERLADMYEYLFGGFDDILSGKYEAAYGRFNRIVEDQPTRGDREALPRFVYYFRGLAAGHIGRWNEAIVDFERLLANSLARQSADSLVYYIPIETNQYRYMLGVLHQRAGNLEEAGRYYRTVLENDIGLYMAHSRLATMAESRQDWPAAIAERRAAVNANPEDASLLLDLGRTLATVGDFGAAEEALQQATIANPRDPRPVYYLGIVQHMLTKRQEARESFQRFIALAPSRYLRQVEDAKQRLAALR
jgi:tetratricopeptide (TPR) repeat protein